MAKSILTGITKLSVKNFIADLPATLNRFFQIIIDMFNKFYNEETNTLTSDVVNTKQITTTSISTQKLTIQNSDANLVFENMQSNIDVLGNRVKTLEDYHESVKTIEEIPINEIENYIQTNCKIENDNI
jgi:hypothetical protein